MLSQNKRYLQIAFNKDIYQILQIIPRLPESDRIILEAGTPYIKKEGASGISAITSRWSGPVVADIKIVDGAEREVEMCKQYRATAVTAIGTASKETLDLFIKKCEELELDSIIDMIGVENPHKVLMKLKKPPKVVVLHKGRDEEQTKGKVIQYKQVNKIRSKFDVLISAAGGVDLREARSAIFNGADIVVANIVDPDDPWTGINSTENINEIAKKFLETIE